MVQYFNAQDNKPDAVSSAHWRDYGVSHSNAPLHKVMCNHLLPPDNLSPPLQHKNTRHYLDLIFAV